jgi:hypothetical protein
LTDKPLSEAPSAETTASASSNLMLSGPMKVDLSIYRGDTGSFRITVTDSVGAPVDMTGATWDGDIRTKVGDPVITNFDIVPVAGDSSSIDVSLTSVKSEMLSGTCVYDIEMRLGTVVSTLIQGTITVTPDVSRPT